MPSPHDNNWKTDIQTDTITDVSEPMPNVGFSIGFSHYAALALGAGLMFVGLPIYNEFFAPPEYAKVARIIPRAVYVRLAESKKVCVNGPASPRACMALWAGLQEVNNIEVSNR